MSEHKSDCSIYNEPAYPKGKCDCGHEGSLNAPGIAEEIRKVLDESEGFMYDSHIPNARSWLRSLLEENNILQDIHATMNMEDELERKRLKDEVRSLRSELVEKDKVLEWYASKGVICRPGEDWDVGYRARSILSQYATEKTNIEEWNDAVNKLGTATINDSKEGETE